MINRREMLLSTAGGLCTSWLANPECLSASQAAPKTRLGIAGFSYNIRLRAERSGSRPRGISEPSGFLEHCHRLGAGGVQVRIGTRAADDLARLRRQAETYGMFIEGSAGLPREGTDIERFEAEVVAAKQAGADVIRIPMGGRRYEQFDRAEQFQAFARRGWTSLELAEPVAARHRVHLAIENHKDWRVPELLDMLQRLSSQYVGVCVDTGNSIALLEDPMEVVRAYAPWAHSAHLKDAALAEHEEGFLLADVPLGQGCLDLGLMVDVLRRATPEINFSLEMATRDPLQVPCLTEKYWVTLAEVPGSDLARTLRAVRANVSEQLPRVSHLSLDEQIRLEEDNIKKCLAYAREHLQL